MKKLSDGELLILITLEKNEFITVKDLSSILQLEKTTIYSYLKNMKSINMIIETKERPKRFIINKNNLEEWKKI